MVLTKKPPTLLTALRPILCNTNNTKAYSGAYKQPQMLPCYPAPVGRGQSVSHMTLVTRPIINNTTRGMYALILSSFPVDFLIDVYYKCIDIM